MAETTPEELRRSARMLVETAIRIRHQAFPGWLSQAMELEAVARRHEERADALASA